MKLLIIVLNREEILDDLLQSMVEAGIFGATIVESVRLAEVIASEIPIFAGLRKMMGGGRKFNRMIFAIVEEEEAVDELVNILKESGIDFSKEETGVMLLLPVEKIWGVWEGV
ncbi:hypothetical protein J7K56_02295 [Candidatus Calescamantes bacterium]|nr:hypothetical protein [Candidatus Calescamantes bacterium]